MPKELIDLTLHLHHETGAAIMVSDDGLSANAVWLPKSQVEFEVKQRGPRGGDRRIVEVTLPEWLAIEKGLA